MPLLLDKKNLELLAKRTKTKKGRAVKPSKKAERELLARLNDLWAKVLFPSTERIKSLIAQGAHPVAIADEMEQMLRTANASYAVMSRDILDRWKMSLDQETRAAVQRSMKLSLGVDIQATLDTPVVIGELNGVSKPFSSTQSAEQAGATSIKTISTEDALSIGGLEAANLVKSIPGEYLGRVAQAVADNFTGKPLPEGRSLLEQVQHIGGVSKRRAKLIARDQTSKMTGMLNATRQMSLGVSEYVWRTVKDNRVVGNPSGVSPVGSSGHHNHYVMEGVRCRWDDPTLWYKNGAWVKRPDKAPKTHPGQEIQCRCYAEPIINPQQIFEMAIAA